VADFYKIKIAAERQKNTELNQQLHVLEQTLKG
jgi:chromosomal replication initiator protein